MTFQKLTKEDILTDKAFNMMLSKKNVSEITKKNYVFSVLYYCNANQRTLTQIYNEQLIEQRDKILHGQILRYNPEFSTLDDYQHELINYLKERDNSPRSINNHLINIKAVLRRLSLQTPTLAQVPEEDSEWFVLTKSEISYGMSISNDMYSCLEELQSCTGFRIHDCLALTWGWLIDNTRHEHGYYEIQDFLYYAPEGMMVKFKFYPHKTRRNKILCMGYNTPWNTDHLIYLLREREKYYERYNKKHGTDYHVERDDPIFASRKHAYKKPLTYVAVAKYYQRKHKQLIKERNRVLKKKLKDEEISKEEYNKLIEESPTFKTHHLRKFFITTLATNGVDLRASALMEGHTPIVKMDSRYVNTINEDMDEHIKNEYIKVMGNFNFNEEGIDFTIKKRNEELESRIKELESEKEDIIERSKVENKKMVLSILKDYGLEVK